ncbi:Asp-tRNA(Asn)/Glu-tRNA(Gln) amidotransferase subunit GatA [Lutispora thermophila]|uniref:Asp-tRNA(Asn)/Glu-tRNA(Gln) amidotransferase subunit GatA n=1 Tax=Lutispora thermophila TaxID=288966 RepID=UPI0009330CB8|nr:Asp-tRNA(Asn)/Glu-tRNA(Gln) amidotransferase subunit GatA [Lutispora thermophila]
MELHSLTIHEIRDMLRAGQICSKDILDSVYSRIEALDDKIGAYLTLTKEEAYEAAAIIDKKIAEGEKLGDLAGIPMAIKDNISTKGVKTTCASKMLENYVPPFDAHAYEKLKEAGAILIGKTNLDEFAMGSSTENSAFKITRNPWDLERVPGGSSGGSAAAVASDEAYFALGSDTGGSIRQPASLCGVVGFKPTYGAVSRYGLVAFGSSFDQIGPFTKDVEDCAILLNHLYGHDKKDSTSLNVEFGDFTEALNKDIKGMRIGLPEEYFGEGIDPEVKKLVLDGVKVLEGLGAHVEEISLPYSKYALPVYYIAASAEASSNLARYDGVRYGYRAKDYSSLEELYVNSRSEGFGEEVKLRIMLGTYTLSSGYYDAYYNKALKVRRLIKQEFEEAFEKYDVLISPTSPTTAFKIGERTDDQLAMYMSDICTVPINIAGIPAISVPCGLSKGLPVGMQIMSKSLGEASIIKVAHAFEQNTNFTKKKPTL